MLLTLISSHARLAIAQAPADSAAISAAMAKLLAAGRHPDLRWPLIGDLAPALKKATAAGPLWIQDGHPSASARRMVAVLQDAATVGLDSLDYDAYSLGAQMDNLDTWPPSTLFRHRPPPSAEMLARFDLALSIAASRYATAIHQGRISPSRGHATLDIPRVPLDVSATLAELSRSADPARVLGDLEPHYHHYALLKGALAHYRSMARDSGLVPLPPLPASLRRDDRYAGAPRLRRLLLELGDLPPGAARPAAGDTVLDASLEEGVRHFQRRQGLTPDGVIGPATAARLNRPFEQRVHQIELTLERWRWLPRAFDAAPLIVNLPAFRLNMFASADDDPAHMQSMAVVVGKAMTHDTPVFADQLEYIVFSPYWELPTSIMRSEVRPQAERDPAYLKRHRYELVGSSGAVVSATPDNIAAIGRGIRVRQLPGDGNSLGRVKFIFPNPHDIYFHDTPSKSLFAETRRDFSHGCVRLGEPQRLAEFLLRDRPEWTTARIAAAMSSDRPTQVNLAHPVPVYILYGTAVTKADGETFFYPDIYGLDRALDALLAKGYPYPR